MNLINLTAHDINIHTPEGVFRLPPSGKVARVVEYTAEAAPIGIVRAGCHGECGGCGQQVLDGEECLCAELGVPWSIPTVRTTTGEVTGLPAPQRGKVFIVSGMVASAAPREDVMSPGGLVRDESGRPCGCKGLSRSC